MRQRLWHKIQRLRGLLVELPTREIVVAEMDSPPPAGATAGLLYAVSFGDEPESDT